MNRHADQTDTCSRCGNVQPAGADYCRHCGLPLYAKPTGWHPRTWWPWTRWFLLHKVLHVDDTPHRIALGLAIGMFVALTPTFGLQMVLIVALAWLLRANKIVGVPLAWITNPVTMGPIYYFNYWIGGLILGRGGKTLEHFKNAFVLSGESWWGDMRQAWHFLLDVFWRCWLGSLLLATILALGTYLVGYRGVIAYRRRHRRQFPGSRFDEEGNPLAEGAAGKGPADRPGK